MTCVTKIFNKNRVPELIMVNLFLIEFESDVLIMEKCVQKV